MPGTDIAWWAVGEKMFTPDLLIQRFSSVRQRTEQLCAYLEKEDYVVQSMPDVSPPKWHLAHTSWFFETFVLQGVEGYRVFRPEFGYLFNSYYDGVGPYFPRPQRGILSRPTVDEVLHYRTVITERIQDFLTQGSLALRSKPILDVIELGIHHEEQHQELLLTDMTFNAGANPLRPWTIAPKDSESLRLRASGRLAWKFHSGGIREIGTSGQDFAFDNERPSHRVYINPFQIATRLATNNEYQDFIGDGGYRRPELWLSEGWKTVRGQNWNAPLYWEKRDGEWWGMTLFGMNKLNAEDPVSHVSYYEADAFARWSKSRLPFEHEWEAIASEMPVAGNLFEQEKFRPLPAAASGEEPAQIYGDLWEWTASAYLPYPGFKPGEGALGEYNGKFMCNQMVLRGGSFATPAVHIRASYRNFFPPEARWQFTGIRLARNPT